MKVLHLIVSQQVAGAENYVLNLLPGLKKAGIDCGLILVTAAINKHKFDGLCQTLQENNIPVSILTGGRSSYFSIAKKVNQYLTKNEIKYLHAHLFNADFLAVLVKKVFNSKIILLSTKHGYQEKYMSSPAIHQKKIVHGIYYYISKYFQSNIDAQFSVSKAMADLYYDLKLIKKQIPFIHHGINQPAFTPGIDKSETKLANPQLIIVGRIEKVKGHTYLLQALPEIVKKYPSVKLLILGNGTEKAALTTEADNLGIGANIAFLGFQSNPYNYIRSSDIIIQPSFFESFGLVYIEAFACHTPVIAFDVPAGNEIIEDNETGLLVPLYDAVALSKKILYLLDNPSERKRLADNAYQKFTDYYNTQRMVDETVAWYQTL